jgi:exopolysaccharide production protein ExoY
MKSIRSGNSQDEQAIAECDSRVPIWKRALDLGCILFTLPMLVPLVSLIALIIRCVSSGPIFFRQQRVGHRGVPFVCWKFRTMRVGADQGVHQDHLDRLIRSGLPMTKMDRIGDPRLIPFGAILRATGLDELPQLFNVLRGEMSLVGPRPCTPYEYELYVPWQRQRFLTLPGLTGLWQVSGKNKTTFDEMVRLDIRYAHTKSFWLDLSIMFRTISALLTQVRETRAAKHETQVAKPLQTASR